MREIEFRGIHLHIFNTNKHLNGSWVYGYLTDENYIYSPDLEGEMLIDSKTIGQYTGLKDHKSKKVFGSDIMKWKSANEEHIGVVTYKFGGYIVRDIDIKGVYLDLYSVINKYNGEVKGNIHENPELLK